MKEQKDFERPKVKTKPTIYDTVLIPRAEEIARMIEEGKSNCEIARYLGISRNSWKKYKKQIEEYLQAAASIDPETTAEKIKAVEKAMFEAAKGITKTVKKAMKVKTVTYKDGKREKEVEKIEYYFEDIYTPPSVSAGQFLLKNWDKTHYSNNPAELEQKKTEFKHRQEQDW